MSAELLVQRVSWPLELLHSMEAVATAANNATAAGAQGGGGPKHPGSQFLPPHSPPLFRPTVRDGVELLEACRKQTRADGSSVVSADALCHVVERCCSTVLPPVAHANLSYAIDHSAVRLDDLLQLRADAVVCFGQRVVGLVGSPPTP